MFRSSTAFWVMFRVFRAFGVVFYRGPLSGVKSDTSASWSTSMHTEERHEIAFPFDPCQLRNAHQFIFQFYREWEDGVDGDDAGLTSSAVTSSPRDFHFEIRMWVEGVWRSSNSSIRFPLVF